MLVQHNDLYEKKKKSFQKEHTNTINKFINLSCAHSMKQKLFVYLFLLFIKWGTRNVIGRNFIWTKKKKNENDKKKKMYTNVRQNYKMYFKNIWLVALVKGACRQSKQLLKLRWYRLWLWIWIYMYMYKCEHINWHCKGKELGTKLASSHSQSRGWSGKRRRSRSRSQSQVNEK